MDLLPFSGNRAWANFHYTMRRFSFLESPFFFSFGRQFLPRSFSSPDSFLKLHIIFFLARDFPVMGEFFGYAYSFFRVSRLHGRFSGFFPKLLFDMRREGLLSLNHMFPPFPS